MKTYRTSQVVQREIEFLSRATGKTNGEILEHAISYFKVIIEAESQGRRVLLTPKSGERDYDRIKLPFKLKEAYVGDLRPIITETNSSEPTRLSWWRRIIRYLDYVFADD